MTTRQLALKMGKSNQIRHSSSTNEEMMVDVDESENPSINSAWGSKDYSSVLTLLQKDSYFPDHFDMQVLNEKYEQEKDLKYFARERNGFHEWIEQGNFTKVKEFTFTKKSKHYCNDKNNSAAFTAIKYKKLEIYAFLQSIGAGFLPHESNYLEKQLNFAEKGILKDLMLSYFSTSKKSHIYYLRSKTKIKAEDSFEKHKKDLFGYFEALDKIEGVSIILKVIQYADNLDLVLDLNSDSVKWTCPFATSADRGLTSIIENTIYIAAGRPKNEILGTLAHELTHLAMELIFKNKTNPYFESDDDSRNEFMELTEFVQDSIKKVEGAESATLTDAFAKNYVDEDQEECELIARIPHILAQYEGGRIWLENNVPKLLQYYEKKVISKCEEFIKQSFLLKPRNSNRSLNESEGEILKMKKCILVFDNIEKIINFLNTPCKRIFSVLTNYTWLSLLRVLQGAFGTNYIEYYDRFLVFKLENCIKCLDDIEYLFKSDATEMFIVECQDVTMGEREIQAIETIIKMASI